MTAASEIKAIVSSILSVDAVVEHGQQVHDVIRQARLQPRISDVHLDPREPVMVRIDGELHGTERNEPIPARAIEEFVNIVAPKDEHLSDAMAETGSYTVIYTSPETGPLRLTLFRTIGGMSIAIRLLPTEPPDLAALELPEIFDKMTRRRHGLSILSGPVGVGKSTALAAVTERTNREQSRVIYTLDDGMEYRFTSRRSRVRQMRIGRGGDAPSYDTALISLLRGDPDMIVVSECRTPESILASLMLAEAGRFVIITLHLESATRVVDRILGAFPPAQQPSVRAMLASTLQDVVYLRLPKRISPTAQFGRVPACEVLTRTDGLSTAILGDSAESTDAALSNYITSHRDLGMRLLEDDLSRLVKRDKVISRSSAFNESIRPQILKDLIGEERSDVPGGGGAAFNL